MLVASLFILSELQVHNEETFSDFFPYIWRSEGVFIYNFCIKEEQLW
jgi:hypothetical protein